MGKNPLFEIYLKEKKVLDIGCGEGNLLRKDRKNIFGIDANQTMIEKLKKEGLNAEYGSVVDMPFKDSYFDAVYCRNIIEHLFPAEAHKMFQEMKRILKSEGKIILISPMPSEIWNTFGHIKPYPPLAIKKLFRGSSLESFDSIEGLAIQNILYLGVWGGNKLILAFSSFLSLFIPYFRGSYIMIIEKYEK